MKLEDVRLIREAAEDWFRYHEDDRTDTEGETATYLVWCAIEILKLLEDSMQRRIQGL